MLFLSLLFSNLAKKKEKHYISDRQHIHSAVTTAVKQILSVMLVIVLLNCR